MNLDQIRDSCIKNINTGIQNVCIHPSGKKKVITQALDLDTTYNFTTDQALWEVDAVQDPVNKLKYTLNFVLPDIKFRNCTFELVTQPEDMDVELTPVTGHNEYDIHFKLYNGNADVYVKTIEWFGLCEQLDDPEAECDASVTEIEKPSPLDGPEDLATQIADLYTDPLEHVDDIADICIEIYNYWTTPGNE